jgi:hypothetical protein
MQQPAGRPALQVSDLLALSKQSETALIASKTSSSSGDQVDDQNDQRYDQEKMNQSAGYMKAET